MEMTLTDLFGDLEDDDDDNEDDESDDKDDEADNVEDIVDLLVDEILLGLSFEVHRKCRLGTFLLDDMDEESQKQYEIKEVKGLDVFGQVPMKKQYDCVCPNCSRNLAASRFAPHLEKCMGMGRNSSRIASRRIANTGKRESDNDSDFNNEDNDWQYTPEKKVKKMKKEKLKKSKSSKSKSGDIPSVGSTNSDGSGSLSYESMSFDERKAILVQTCGVISEHTKKMCTRSIRCPQHTDDQRRAVRLYLLTQPGIVIDDDVIDIDTYDDAETQALRDTLQWEASSNPSPADSTSTTASNHANSVAGSQGSSSKKRKISSKHSSSSSKSKKKSSHSHSNHSHSSQSGHDSQDLRTTPTKTYDFE